MEAMIHHFPVRRLSKDEASRAFHDQGLISSSLIETERDTLSDSPLDTVDVCTTQLWLPVPFEAWNGFPDWSPNLVNETWPYQYQVQNQPWSGATNVWATDCRANSSSSVDSPSVESVPFGRSREEIRSEQLDPSQILPQVKTQHTYRPEKYLRPENQDEVGYPDISQYHTQIQSQTKLLESDWMGFSPRATAHRVSQAVPDTKPNPNTSASVNFIPQWPPYTHLSADTQVSGSNTAIPTSKRKHASPGPPPAKKIRQAKPQAKLAEFVGVFENEPGALTTVKKRKKLDVAVRKAAQDVRKAGACHQCRFRKRTCSTGTPCTSCVKNGRGLHDLKCQRESPFLQSKEIYTYFEHSSSKRFLTFHVALPAKSRRSSDLCWVTIDGIGKLSHPIKLRAYAKPLDTFNIDDQTAIEKTGVKSKPTNSEGSETILLLDNHENIGVEVEQWAVEYASKFCHAAGPKFYPTTAAVILATAYLKKGLPESELMAAMLRAASISFVLRAGIKYTTSETKSSSQYRTIQASVDTILYQRLKLAEKDMYALLQRIVFRSLGYIRREQIYPVALVFWQLLRMLSLSSSHLSNISERYKSIPSEHASFQYHALKLVLSTHLALFRSSNPLLLDYNDKPNQDLLGGEKELIDLAMAMRKVVLDFRAKGVTDMKGSIAYRKEHFDIFRKAYHEL